MTVKCDRPAAATSPVLRNCGIIASLLIRNAPASSNVMASVVPLRKGHQIKRWHLSCKFSHMNWVNAGALIGCSIYLFFLTWLTSLMCLLLCLIKFIKFYIIFLCCLFLFVNCAWSVHISLLIQTKWLFMDKGRKGDIKNILKMDLILTSMLFFTLQVDYLGCFNQLFGLWFWRHPFTTEDPFMSKMAYILNGLRVSKLPFWGEPFL